MKATLLTLVLALLLVSSAFATLQSIQVEPAEPIAGQPVSVTISGYMPDSCWSLVQHTCGEWVDGEIVVAIDTYSCESRGCDVCLTLNVEFEVTCAVTFPHSGSFVIRAVENWDSLSPIVSPDLTRTVAVMEPVTADARSWSAVKSLYR
jgi:hypothetical protein